MDEPVDTWDTLIIYLVTTKLDDVTLRKWEQAKASYKTLTLESLNKFLKKRADLLESVEYCKSSSVSATTEKPYKFNRKTKPLRVKSPTSPKCTFCKKDHFIQNCEDF